MSPAQRGATALVPPIGMIWPSTRIGVTGIGIRIAADIWHPPSGMSARVGRGWDGCVPLIVRHRKHGTDPASACSLPGPSFHTVSDRNGCALHFQTCPPHPRAWGAEAGKSTCWRPSATPSSTRCRRRPRSPSHPCRGRDGMLAPSGSWPGESMCSPRPPADRDDRGVRVVSWTALLTASMKPWSVLGAK